MRTTDKQFHFLYSKIYELVEFAEFEIDNEDLTMATDLVINHLELDERFYHIIED